MSKYLELSEKDRILAILTKLDQAEVVSDIRIIFVCVFFVFFYETIILIYYGMLDCF